MDGRRLERMTIATAALLVFSRVFGLSLVMPDFRAHYEGEMSILLIGIAFGAHGITMALMQFPNGILSDRFGRVPILWSASILFVAGCVAAAFTTGWALVAARLLQGLGAVGSVAIAAVGDTVPEERRTMAMTLVGIPAGTGFFFGIAAGPILYEVWSMQGLFLTAAVIGVLPMLFLPAVKLPRPTGRSRSDVESEAPATVPRLAQALLLVGFAANLVMTIALFHLGAVDWRLLSPVMAVALVALVVASRAVDKSGLTWQPIPALVVAMAIAAPLFATGNLWGFAVGGALFFAFHGVLSSVVPSQVSRLSGARGGRGHGLQNVVGYLGTATGGPLAALLYPAAGPTFAIGIGVAVMAAGGVLLWRPKPRPKPSS